MNQQPPKRSGAQLIFNIFTAAVILVIVAIFCLPSWFYFSPSKIVANADAGFKKAKQTIDPEKLRAWALKEIPQYTQPTNEIIPPKIKKAEIPSCIQSLYSQAPEDAFVQKEGYVQIFWGGPFFHWSLEIGPTNFVPAPDSHVKTAEWIPGIYYNREDATDLIK